MLLKAPMVLATVDRSDLVRALYHDQEDEMLLSELAAAAGFDAEDLELGLGEPPGEPTPVAPVMPTWFAEVADSLPAGVDVAGDLHTFGGGR